MNPVPDSLPRKATRITTLTALGLVAVKTAIGLQTGSVAVLASAADSFLDFLVSSFNVLAVRSSERPNDEYYNYGRGKVEGLAAACEGLFILASAVFIVKQAVSKLLHPRPLSAFDLNLAIGVMAFSLTVTVALTAYLRRATRKTRSLVVEADALHYRTDLLSNAAVLLALIAIRVAGWQAADPLLALAVSLYIAKASLPLIRKGLDMLLDRALSDAVVRQIRLLAEAHSPLVNGVHEIKTRRSGDMNFVEFHLVFDEHITLGEAHRVADEIEMKVRALEKSKWSINIHLDPHDDSMRDQHLAAEPLLGPL